MAFFLYGNLRIKIAITYHSYISYSYQLNLVELPTKIFGLQGEAREKIKQETKVIDNLISLNSLHCQINLSKLQYI